MKKYTSTIGVCPLKKILCVCIGNSDRSPVMAAVLGMFLEQAGHDVSCESAGISENARAGTATQYGIAAAGRIGLDLTGHQRRYVGDLDIKSYDLIICASDEIAGSVIALGADMEAVYTVPIANPWPVKFQEDYDFQTMPAILAGMYMVVTRYFS